MDPVISKIRQNNSARTIRTLPFTDLLGMPYTDYTTVADGFQVESHSG